MPRGSHSDVPESADLPTRANKRGVNGHFDTLSQQEAIGQHQDAPAVRWQPMLISHYRTLLATRAAS